MKFSINQNELDSMINIANKAVSPHSTIPALAGLLLQAEENEVTMTSTNLELNIQVSAPALIEEDGQVLIPAKILGDIVKAFPDEAVSFETTDEGVLVSCGKSKGTFKTLVADDFPDFPKVETTESVKLPFKDFSNMVKKVAKIVSKDESRAILQGVNVIVQDGKLEMVATDAYRIAIARSSFDGDGQQDVINKDINFTAVIPGDFLMNIAAVSANIETATVSLSQNQVVVACNDIIFVNRRIEGNFPSYQQLLPESSAIKTTISKDALAAAVRRISALPTTNPTVQMDFDKNSNAITLKADSKEIGSIVEAVDCTYSDDSSTEPLTITFNSNYVSDGLGCIDTKNLTLEVQDYAKPGIFKDETGNSLIYILLSVTV